MAIWGKDKSNSETKTGAVRKGATRKVAATSAKPVVAKDKPINAGKLDREKKEHLPKGDKAAKKPKTSQAYLSPYLTHHKLSARSSLERFKQNWLASFMTSLLVAVSLALPMLLLILVSNLQSLSQGWEEQISISVYLKPEVSVVDHQDISSALEQHAMIESSQYVSPDQGLEEFQGFIGKELFELFESNPLPGVYEVVPNFESSEAEFGFKIQSLVADIEALQGVDQVKYDMVWIERLLAYVSFAERFAWLVGVLLAFAVVLSISNSIRLEIENRRQEIVVIKLVGATDAYVRLPFLYSGFWFGLAGGVLALFCLLVAIMLVAPVLQNLLNLYGSGSHLVYLSFLDVILLLCTAILIAVTGAWLAVYRHLREIEPE